MGTASNNVYYSDQGRLLRCGYTTGSCATAASRSALIRWLYPDREREEITIRLPEGEYLEIPVLRSERLDEGSARASVIKDAGDDADVTHGIEIVATLRMVPPAPGECPEVPEIVIDGGAGVGRVTKGGLQIPVGEAAINPVPRTMIAQNLLEVWRDEGASRSDAPPIGRIEVTIEAVGGEEIAKRTFNERLGILGGISIIGTSGIVRPMSEDAFKASIHAELRQKYEQGVRRLVLVPGKHGENFAIADGFSEDQIVHMSNFVGFALHSAVRLGFESALIVGHIGKLIKLSAGIFNTHSKIADARAEIIAAQMAIEGFPLDAIRSVYAANTTDEAAEMLRALGRTEVFQSLAERAKERCYDHIRPDRSMGIDLVFYDMPGHRLGDTRDAGCITEKKEGQ